MTVETRSGGDALRKQESRISLLQVLDEKTTKLQQFWSSKPEGVAGKTDRHGAGDTSWIESLQDCPVYYPTKQEFTEDPLCYIQRIAGEASKYGICKVVSPVVASVPAGVVLSKEKSGFKFSTRLQPMRISNWDKDDKVAFPIKGRHYTLTEYEKVANRFFSRKFSTSAGLPPKFIESIFWKELVSGKTRSVEYATDVDGSAFSTARSDPLGQSKWNLKGISKLPGSVLRLLEEAIPGVTEPMLYIGMLFSMFAWHIEDHYLYSINYQHCGAPKTWYGVPGDAALDFEKVAKEHVYSRELLNNTGRGAELDLLLAKTTMFAPRLLLDHGVPVFRGVQYPGEFIITFPRAYHAGFSHGFNCGEAVNFAVADWFPFGAEACSRYEFLSRPPILPHDELLCKEATAVIRKGRKDSSCMRRICIMNSFVALMHSEQQAKSALEMKYARTVRSTVVDISCGLCKHKCYVSYTHCKCFSEPTCLKHADVFNNCSCAGDRIVFFREDFEKLVLAAKKFKNDITLRQHQKLSSDCDTAKRGESFSSVLGVSKCSSASDAKLSRKARYKQEDEGDACSGVTSLALVTSGGLAIASSKQAVEEDESDREFLKLKRRRVASTQSERFLVEKQTVCKSLVRSLDFGSYSPVRDIQEHLHTHRPELFKSTPMTGGDLMPSHFGVDEISGPAVEVVGKWKTYASKKGWTFQLKGFTVGQKASELISLKSLSCMKYLVSGEEAMILQKLLWKVGLRGLKHGRASGRLVALDKWTSSKASGDECEKVERFSTRRESLESLYVIPIVGHVLLSVTSGCFGSAYVNHSDNWKNFCAKSNDIRDFTSIASPRVLHCESAQELHNSRHSRALFTEESAISIEVLLNGWYPENSCINVTYGSTSMQEADEPKKDKECLSSESLCIEPERSAPLTALATDHPVAATCILEKVSASSQNNSGSQGGVLDARQSGACQSQRTENANGGVLIRDFFVPSLTDRGTEVQPLARKDSIRYMDDGMSCKSLQRRLLSPETNVYSCKSVALPRNDEEMGRGLGQDTIITREESTGRMSEMQQGEILAKKEEICAMQDVSHGNVQRIPASPECQSDTSQSAMFQIKNVGIEIGLMQNTVWDSDGFLERENRLEEPGSNEEDKVCDMEEVSHENVQEMLAKSESMSDTSHACILQNKGDEMGIGMRQGINSAAEEFMAMGNGEQQVTALVEEDSICNMEEKINDLSNSPCISGAASTNSEASHMAQPQEATKRSLKRASVANPEELFNDHVKPKITKLSPSLPKQGLVIYLNRKMEHNQGRPAKLTHDQNTSENDYDQVDLLDDQMGGDTWSVDEGIASLCSAQNQEPVATSLEQSPSIQANSGKWHLLESDGVQEVLAKPKWLHSISLDEFQSSMRECDGAEEPFAGSLDARISMSLSKEPIVRIDNWVTPVSSSQHHNFSVWEPINDGMEPNFSFKQTNGIVDRQLVSVTGNNKASNLETVNPLSYQEEGLPALISEQQRVEPSLKTFGELSEEMRSFPEMVASGLDAHSSRREPFTYGAQFDGCLKSNPYACQYGWSSWEGCTDFLSNHIEGQRAPNNLSNRYRGTVRLPMNHYHRSNSRDAPMSTKYPPVFRPNKHFVPRAHSKRRGNRKNSFGWKYRKHRNAIREKRIHSTIDTDRNFVGCSLSALDGTGDVEGYDPVRWEISPCARRQHFSSSDLWAPSSSGDASRRVF